MRNLIGVLFVSIAFILFSCQKNKTPEPTPEPIPVEDYTGDYAGTHKWVETYPNNQTKMPYTKAQGYHHKLIKKNSKGYYLFDQSYQENLYFSAVSKTISKGKVISQGTNSQSLSVKWEIKGDSLIGTTIENFANSVNPINNTKSTTTYNLKLKK